jgi:hypothetical protein
MKRTPMQRTAFLRAEPKPATGKPKPRKCKACRAPYQPDPKQPFVVWCSPDCAVAIAQDRVAKQKAAKAKAERAADRKRKEEGMRHADRLELVQKLANRCAVLRDWHDGCISCDKGPNWNGTWHGSHYKSVGSNSALRYNLFNISKACSQCNWHRAGNIAEYEPRLALKWGDERLEWLKSHPRSREYSTEYLIRFAAVARKWIKRREKRLGIR